MPIAENLIIKRSALIFKIINGAGLARAPFDLREFFDHFFIFIKGRMSFGFLLATSPLSVTTSMSTDSAPTLIRSVLRDGHEVMGLDFFSLRKD
jgi:hypothetical protein